MNDKRKTDSTADAIVSQGKQLALQKKKLKNIKTRQDEIEKKTESLDRIWISYYFKIR